MALVLKFKVRLSLLRMPSMFPVKPGLAAPYPRLLSAALMLKGAGFTVSVPLCTLTW